MNSVIESVSQAIVTKFMNNPELMDKLTKKVIQSGVFDRVKQELRIVQVRYRKLESRIGDLESSNDKLRTDSDAHEQYRSFLKMLNIACSQNAKYFVRIVD